MIYEESQCILEMCKYMVGKIEFQRIELKQLSYSMPISRLYFESKIIVTADYMNRSFFSVSCSKVSLEANVKRIRNLTIKMKAKGMKNI